MDLLDRSVVFSFDRTGFRRHQRRFSEDPERSLQGTRALITGGTAGIGRAAAAALATRGATVELWARDAQKGDAAAKALRGGFTRIDLGDLDAVGRAAHRVQGPLSAVVLNAGAMPLERQMTPQGHELVWASQVLAHLLLLRVLHARALLTTETRVIWVSSGGMYLASLDLSDLTRERSYQRHSVYANAKRAQVELSAHLATRWPMIPMAAMHPGWVATEGVRMSMPWFHRLTRPVLRTTEQGADTIVWLATTAQAPPTGRFWFDREAVSEHRREDTKTDHATRTTFLQRSFSATEPYMEGPG